jgi:hypothetical protein
MSKYQPLSDHLAASPGDEWLTSFAELETVLGFPLPKAARSSRTWWANDPEKSHSRAWAVHGWEVGDVDHAAERVVFRRGGASALALQAAAQLKPLAQAPAASEPVPPVPPVPRGAGEADSPPARPLLVQALRPVALASAGFAVLATMSAFMLGRMMRRR